MDLTVIAVDDAPFGGRDTFPGNHFLGEMFIQTDRQTLGVSAGIGDIQHLQD